MNDIVTPDRLSKDGKKAYQHGDYIEAAKTFEAARQAYLESNDELNAAEMANNASVAHLQADDAEAAYKAAEGTPEIFARAGDLRRQGMALGNLAAALEAMEKAGEALDLYQQSADVLAQAGEDQMRASVMQSLSMLQFREGRQLQALATMQSGVEGVKHPTPKQSFLKQLLRIPMQMATRGKP